LNIHVPSFHSVVRLAQGEFQVILRAQLAIGSPFLLGSNDSARLYYGPSASRLQMRWRFRIALQPFSTVAFRLDRARTLVLTPGIKRQCTIVKKLSAFWGLRRVITHPGEPSLRLEPTINHLSERH
jgi:hypothetical protein